ncbi:MAG: CotH kinase family protein [Lachnospiraceae bacterium]
MKKQGKRPYEKNKYVLWFGAFLLFLGVVLFFSIYLMNKGPALRAVLKVTVNAEEVTDMSFLLLEQNKKLQSDEDVMVNISWQKDRDGKHNYLFLPAFADLSDVSIWLEQDGNGTETELSFENANSVKNLQPGVSAMTRLDLQPGDNTITVNGKQTNFTIMKSERMPSMWIETEEDFAYLQEDKEHTSSGYMRIYSEKGLTTYLGEIERMSGHGNSTWGSPKKSFALRLEKDGNLLDMSSSNKWLLISNGMDHSLLRNKLVYDMAKECGLPGSIDSEWTDLYVNGVYQGLYLLTEKIDISSSGLDIGNLEKDTAKVNQEPLDSYDSYAVDTGVAYVQAWQIPENPADITGGYLMEVDYPTRYDAEPSKFRTKQNQYVVLKNPSYATPEQIHYIFGFVQNFEDALYDEKGINESGISYLTYMDLESFAGRYVLDEITKNIDAGYSSYFFYKPRYVDKLYAGPVWDYDTAFGNAGEQWESPDGFYVNQSNWSEQFYQKTEFQEEAKRQYREIYAPYLEQVLEKKYDTYLDYIRASACMDQALWMVNDMEQEWEEVRSFIRERKAFLDEEWGE